MKRINTRSVFGQFLIMFICVLILPLTIGWIAVYYAGKTVENEIYNLNTSILNLVSGELDKNISKMKEMTAEMSINNRLNEFSYVKLPLTNNNRIQIYNMIKDFDTLLSRYDFINQFYFYFKGTDRIVTSTGAFEPKLYYDHFIRGYGIDYEKWYSSIKATNNKGEILDNKNELNINPQYEYLLYRQTIISHNSLENYVNAFVLVDKDRVRDIIDEVVWNDGSGIYVIDGKNALVTSNMEEAMPQKVFGLELDKWSKIIHKKGIYAVSKTKSNVFDWEYVFIVPLGTLMKELIAFKLVMTNAFFVILGLGIILSIIMAYKSYKPVRKIVQKMRSTFDTSPQENELTSSAENEFSYIFRTVESSFEKVSAVHVKLKQQQNALRDEFLYNLIIGQLADTRKAKETIDYYNIDLAHQYFTVLICQLEFEGEIKTLEEYEIEKIIKPKLPENSACYITWKSSFMRYLILVAADKIVDDVNFSQIGADLTEALEKTCSTSCVLSVGKSYENADKISKSYNQALRCLEYQFIQNSQQTILYKDIDENAMKYYYPEHIENQLLNNILIGHSEDVSRTITELFHENVEIRRTNPEMIKIFLLKLVNTLLRAEEGLKKQGKTIEISKSFDLDYMISSNEAIKNVEEEFVVIFEELCLKSSEDHQIQSLSNWRIQKVVDYINEHYTEYDLSLIMLADKFSITTQHLSSAFKAQVGENILNYIQKIRIARVKELLRTTSLTIDNIGKVVGFGNYLSLTRTFKKFEGVTPGVYRNELMKKDSIL